MWDITSYKALSKKIHNFYILIKFCRHVKISTIISFTISLYTIVFEFLTDFKKLIL